MPSKPKSQPPPEDHSELTAAVRRLADIVAMLTTAVEDLTEEIQWQNNERSQDYRSPQLSLTKMPLDPTTRDWHPTFGREPESLPQPPVGPLKTSQSSLFG